MKAYTFYFFALFWVLKELLILVLSMQGRIQDIF